MQTRAPEAFYLLAPSDDTKVRIKILDSTLFVTQVALKPPLLIVEANVLEMKRKAHYPVTHTQINTCTESSGSQQVSIVNAFLGPIPERILIVLVKNTAFVSSASTNPFNFQHYDMTSLVFYVNGVQYPPETLTMNTPSPFGTTRAYKNTLFEYRHTSRGPCSYDYPRNVYQGYYILGFDLTTDREADEKHISLPRQGNVRIEARFKKPLPETVTCIFMLNSLDTSRLTTLETSQ